MSVYKILMISSLTTLTILMSGFVSAKDALSELSKGAIVYNLLNLHADPTRHTLSSVNYQLEGLIPRCTALEITDAGKKRLKFKIKESGIEYSYDFHAKSTPGEFDNHLAKVFAAKCNTALSKNLNNADQAGIKTGLAKKGMSKNGVLLALGYPPEHITPDPKTADQWTYWKNKFNRFIVHFNSKGIVENVQQ
ncbi:MAG: hypothetical protein H0W44_00290 [Gammaproteobacteria bacterium]|nr:hypothetical protein [Gammaproteobacteria bacterium]